MKTVVILGVLVLALIGGAAAAAEKKETVAVEKKEAAELKGALQPEKCQKVCLDKQLKEPTCKKACALNERFNSVWLGALQCSLKCAKKHGIDSPAAKACGEESCKKEYEEKVKKIAESCGEVCKKEEKDKLGVEKCKKICAPSLIYKEMQEKVAKDKAAAKDKPAAAAQKPAA